MKTPGADAMTRAYEIVEHSYDVVIVVAGGAGLRAALGMASSGLKTGVRHEGVSHAKTLELDNMLAQASVSLHSAFGTHGKPGRACARRLTEARRRELAQAHAVLAQWGGERPPRLPASSFAASLK
jgi:thioredoxin reductase